MRYSLTVTIDQTDEGRFRASYSDPLASQPEKDPWVQGSIVRAEQAELTQSLEADNFATLMDRLKDVLDSLMVRESTRFGLASFADEDAEDLADARASMEDVRKNGGIPGEQVEAEMGF